uniref:nucleolin 1-like n=1 Tax=Gasterosteus aculeatus aculeatus TaxID=481459 RepID=UPI001A992373|nr:nucleolin 1-like [Gasterosteus aculeatus aculeatus]
MLKACSLVVLTLVLHLQLCSSAPTPAKVVQVRGARPEEPAPVTEDLSNLMEEKEADDEKVLTAVPGQAAPSPDEENMFIAKEPEPISSEDHISDDDFLEAGELASQEPSAGAHHESSEDETVSEEAAFVESSPEEATDNIAPAVAFESEHFVENTAPKEEDYFVPVPAELEREEAGQWETAAEEHALFVPADPAEEDLNREETVLIIVDQNGGTVEPAAEQTASQVPSPEDLVDFAPLGPTKVEKELREQVVEESIPVVSPEAPKEDAAEGLVQIVPEEDPATMEEALAGPPKDELSVSDTEEKGQVELAAEETSPVLEEPALPGRSKR